MSPNHSHGEILKTCDIHENPTLDSVDLAQSTLRPGPLGCWQFKYLPMRFVCFVAFLSFGTLFGHGLPPRCGVLFLVSSGYSDRVLPLSLFDLYLVLTYWNRPRLLLILD